MFSMYKKIEKIDVNICFLLETELHIIVDTVGNV